MYRNRVVLLVIALLCLCVFTFYLLLGAIVESFFEIGSFVDIGIFPVASFIALVVLLYFISKSLVEDIVSQITRR